MLTFQNKVIRRDSKTLKSMIVKTEGGDFDIPKSVAVYTARFVNFNMGAGD